MDVEPRSARSPGTSPWRLSAHALSNTRLAMVACTLLATVAMLFVVTNQGRDAEVALDEVTAHTLRDYSGYASRMLGADMLRRFADQRASVLAPVTGSSGRSVAPPTLDEIARRGAESFATFGVRQDSSVGYYLLDVANARMQGIGGVKDAFSSRIADTLRTILSGLTPDMAPNVLSLDWRGSAYSVAYAPLFDARRQLVAVYGFAYARGTVVSAIAGSVYREVPLLPVSFAGTRWNYDTTRVRNGEVLNDSLLAMRVRDRLGRLLWESPDANVVLNNSPYGARTVLSTAAGGFVVEAAVQPVAGKSLIPTIVRSSQRWTLRALIALALLLVVVSLIALRGERNDAHARRVEGMQQLALGLRHEINNALASMMLNAELLNEERSLTAEQHERLDAIVEQAERMRKVVRRLERSDKLDVLVPYLNEGLMVDLSTTKERDVISEFSPRPRDQG